MGYKVNKNTPPMERELRYLIHDLCVQWGFCIPPDNQDYISLKKTYSSKDFAKDVVNAEGLDAEYELKYVRDISNKFKERFGTSNIDHKTFIDRVRGQKELW